MGEGVSLVSEFGSIGYLNYYDGMIGRSVIKHPLDITRDLALSCRTRLVVTKELIARLSA